MWAEQTEVVMLQWMEVHHRPSQHHETVVGLSRLAFDQILAVWACICRPGKAVATIDILLVVTDFITRPINDT